MLLATTQKQGMSQPNAETERQNLLERLLDAVKQCQVRFGGKTELATDGDSRVTCLLSQFDNVLQHGFRRPRSSAFRHVGQVAGIVKQEPEQVYWNFVKEHLSKMEAERFFCLHNVTTDTGRGKAWLRSSINERTLEKYFHTFISGRTIMCNFYEPEAFLMDEERASMLPMMAAGLSSILFALNIDSEELNASKLNMSPPSTREVLNILLPVIPVPTLPVPTNCKPQPEPQPVYSAEIAEKESMKMEKKKKKKKKKVSAAIVSIEEEINDTIDSGAELEKAADAPSATPQVLSGHSRSFSYPGRSTSIRTEKSQTPETGMRFLDITKTTSVPDCLAVSLQQENNTEEEQNDGKTFVESFKFKPIKPVPRTLLGCESKNGKVDFFVRSSKDKYDANHEDVVCDYQKVMKNKDGCTAPCTGGLMSVTPVALQRDEPPCGLSEHLYTAFKETERETSSSLRKGDNQICPLEQKNNLHEIVCRNPSLVSPTVSNDRKQSDFENRDLQARESKLLNTMEGQLLIGSPVVDCSTESDSPVAVVGGEVQLMTIITDNDEDTEMVIQIPQQESEGSSQTDQVNPVDSSKDDLSVSSSFSWAEDGDITELSPYSGPELRIESLESLEAAVGATATALAACSDSQIGMERETRFSALARTPADTVAVEDSGGHDGMSKVELKQAIVSMMLRKDDIEEQNRSLCHLLDREMLQSSDLRAEIERLNVDKAQRSNKDQVKIQTLARENELLKHQLKKYVGAVQMLRRDLKGQQSTDTTEALLGIRQDEVLPSLPPKEKTEKEQSEETNEYKRKLIQVAEMHGELMEFNERLQRQLNYRTVQVQRLREELVNLRGPLPGNNDTEDDITSLSDFECSTSTINARPLINIWIPSVFLKGKTSSVYHIYQVYVRIKDDEWNVYRRYSQFYDLHKKLRHQFKRKVTFSFPPKKSVGNRDSRFVEERRKQLQEYLRKVINYLVQSNPELSTNTSRETLLALLPFLGDPYPPEKSKKTKNKNTSHQEPQQYQGL